MLEKNKFFFLRFHVVSAERIKVPVVHLPI